MGDYEKHPETGSHIAQATEEFDHVAEDVLDHHEAILAEFKRCAETHFDPRLVRIIIELIEK